MDEHERTGSAEQDGSRVGGNGRSRSGDDDVVDVVVLGGGLAGLTAAATAAREGRRVTVLERRSLGGRAATTTVDPGVVLNGGPRAFYRGGPGAAVLGGLGIVPRGGQPDAAHGKVVHRGVLHPMPGAPRSLVRTSLLSPRSKFAAAKLLARLERLDVEPLAGRSVTQWMQDMRFADDLRELLAMLIRTASYCAELDALSAGAALRQVQLALGAGVSYLDGGFQQLVDALADEARRSGATILTNERVRAIEPATSPGSAPGALPARWTVTTANVHLHARAVVLATGGPESMRSLSPEPLELDGVGAPATAACLELAVRGPVAQPIVLGDGVPLYLSVHQPPADLAPEGISVVHAMRYGARSSGEDAAELWQLAALGGITEDRVVAHRFLHRMVVTGGIPLAAAGGLAGRPSVRVAGADGLFLAGDWVGPEGMLADAALVSGRAAGALAAEVAGLHAPRQAARVVTPHGRVAAVATVPHAAG